MIRLGWIPAVFVLLSTTVEAAALYTITDLGTLPGTSQSVATGINDFGQVIGYANNLSDGGLGPEYNPRSFLYSNGQMTPITPTGGGAATAINNLGEVVGGAYVSVNNAGQTVGSSFQIPYSVTFNGETATQANFQPVGINDAGQIAGTISKPLTGGVDAAIYQNGKVFDIAKALGLSGDPTMAMAINRVGDVMFSDFHASDRTTTFIIYKADGTSQTLMAGGPANGMNNLGQLVGNTGLYNNGFLYSNGSYEALNSLLPPTSQSLWQFLDPMAINDEGEIIVGYGQINGEIHAFLMTPTTTPEPSALILLITATTAFSLREWKRRRTNG